MKKPNVMFAGLGHAGTKIAITAARQFALPLYTFAAIDIPNETINLDANDVDRLFPMEGGWEASFSSALDGITMLVLTLGLGGKTGIEAAKAAIAAAASRSIPVIVLATTPFSFEGEQRHAAAARGATALRQTTNAAIILPNDQLFAAFSAENTNCAAAFEQADVWVAEVASSILRPFTYANLINVRPQNLEWLLTRKNAFVSVGIGWGEGENAVQEAVQQLSECVFLRSHAGASQADAALVMVSIPDDTTFGQAMGCLTAVKRLFATRLKLEIGLCQDETLAEGIRIVALMRFPARNARQAEAAISPQTASSTVQDAESPDTPHSSPAAEAASTEQPDNGGELQLELPIADIAEYKTGFFSKSSPTRHNFENLDIPTYMRQKIPIDNR